MAAQPALRTDDRARRQAAVHHAAVVGVAQDVGEIAQGDDQVRERHPAVAHHARQLHARHRLDRAPRPAVADWWRGAP